METNINIRQNLQNQIEKLPTGVWCLVFLKTPGSRCFTLVKPKILKAG